MVSNTFVKLMVAGACCMGGSAAMAATTFANGGFTYGAMPTVSNDTSDPNVYFQSTSSTQTDFATTSPWVSDTDINSAVLKPDASGISSFAQISGSTAEIVQMFSVDTTDLYRFSFAAWGVGRLVMAEVTSLNAYVSVPTQTNLQQSTGSAYIYSRTTDGFPGGTGVSINTGTSQTWGHYSFDVQLEAGKQYDLFAAAGLSNNGNNNQGAVSGVFAVDNFAVAEVPEPETYAMMLSGLGALCFMARRRRNDGRHISA